MNKYVLALAALIVVVTARPEPPLEGATLDPELLARIRNLLTQDGPGFGGGSSSSGSSGSSSASRSSYSAPAPPSNTYGAPSGGISDVRSIAAAVAPSGGITLLDPELAPLLTTFDLPATSENRGRSAGY
ncbi:unnamed protein product [Orchesella dallaii]|uniref:Uncharacterized protein n=1 Tax=Orchesella dallaii TaxID=48710 RepID=A0ABP1QGF2_9HEXA